MKFELLQVNDENRRNFAFIGTDFLKDLKEEVKLDRYNKVYEGKEGERNFLNADQFLDNLFREFNIGHPADFKGRSMSVSDLVKVNGKYYYCDNCGWTEVEPK